MAFLALGAVLIGVLVVAGTGGDGPGDRPPAPPSPTGTPAPADRSSPADRPSPGGGETPAGPEGDVRITGCGVDATTEWPSADLSVTNRSRKAGGYVIEVEFVDGTGKRLAEAPASVSNLAAGQRAEAVAQSPQQVSGDVTCRVTDVTRFAS
ncbi:hypothetical protein [Streptomyces sp. DH12]|uniref:hypothetical protein n=1 Tax=Streptomyces sp. DH12 TaxID=2857010 RepID=UPI001E2C0627|nr:hypothetical protein [Streptomyces sp. DH12]